MYFNNLVRTKRLEYMLTFLVGIICFFLIAIFSSILIAWKMTLTNILMFNKKINIIFKFLSIRSRRRKRILTKNRSRRAPLLVVRIVHQFRNFTQNTTNLVTIVRKKFLNLFLIRSFVRVFSKSFNSCFGQIFL